LDSLLWITLVSFGRKRRGGGTKRGCYISLNAVGDEDGDPREEGIRRKKMRGALEVRVWRCGCVL
jgi:hypothetical protein